MTGYNTLCGTHHRLEFRNRHILQQLAYRNERCCQSCHIQIQSGRLGAFAGDRNTREDTRRAKARQVPLDVSEHALTREHAVVP